MGKNLEKQYAFRCDDETIKKLEYIASKNTRTRNQEMKHIVKQYIDTYEHEHGEIRIKEDAVGENTGGKTVNIGRDNKGTINM